MRYDVSFEPTDTPSWATEPDEVDLPATPGFSNHWVKRGFDIVLALILLPAIAPVVAVLWLLVRRDGGSGFFGHERIGQGQRGFVCWKLRTMRMDAEAQLDAHLAADPAAAREWALHRKLTDDPRITPLGRILRQTSLDELPQIWNVLRGEMSFVGPRPIVGTELARYGMCRWAYFDGRPGITGLWQVSGRNDISYAARVQLDVEYRMRASLWLDLRVIALTARTVLRRTGK